MKMPTHAWCAVPGNVPPGSYGCDGVRAQRHAEWRRRSERWAAANTRRIRLRLINKQLVTVMDCRNRSETGETAPSAAQNTRWPRLLPRSKSLAGRVEKKKKERKRNTRFDETFFSLGSHLQPLFWAPAVHSQLSKHLWRLMSDDRLWGGFFSLTRLPATQRLLSQPVSGGGRLFLVGRWRPWGEP